MQVANCITDFKAPLKNEMHISHSSVIVIRGSDFYMVSVTEIKD